MTTDFWNGTGNWSTDNAAWTPDNAPPGTSENAEIQTGTANLTSATAIAALQVDAPAELELTTGGTLVATGTATVSGNLFLQNGPSLNVAGGFSLTGSALVEIDGTNIGGGGGSTLTVGGTLTNSSTNGNGLNIGNSGITAGDTVTAASLNNTGVIQITGASAVQTTLNITTGAAGFGTLAVETGSVSLTNDALLEFASGQIGTIDGFLGLNGANARIADFGTLATNSALAGLNTIAGTFYEQNGASVTTTGGLSLTGNALVEIDGTNIGGNGGSTLTVGGTLTNSSTNGIGLNIGNGNITIGDTVTAASLNNTGVIQITGASAVQATLNITTGAAGFGTLAVETGSISLTNDALLEFANGQIGTIDGFLSLNGPNARIADFGTLATNSALARLNTIAGTFYEANGASVTTAGGLSLIGSALVEIDGTNIGGNGGSTLTVGGTLTNSSTNGNGLDIGNGNITAGDTVTAQALNNTGVIQITGAGTVQATVNITTGAAGFGTLAVETGSVYLTNDALLEFASGQIGTIDGFLSLNGPNARIADFGTLATNSALAGLNTIAGTFYEANGASVTTTGGLSLTGSTLVEIDGTNIGGGGGTTLTVGGTLTNSSTNGNGLNIGNGNITSGDTVTAQALNNTGVIQITGAGTVQATVNITTGAAGFGTLAAETGSVYLTNDALLEFASGQIGTIDGFLSLNGPNARIADFGTLATNSALAGLNTIAGTFYEANGASVTTTGGLSLTGSTLVEIDGTNIGGGGGTTLTVGGTLTNSSTNGNGLNIGNGNITSGDTVTAQALNNTGVTQITGAGTVQSTVNIATGAAGFGTLAAETGSVYLTNDALLEFASGQIGTIDGFLSLNGANARIADFGTLATNSALAGLNTVAGTFVLYNGASVTTTGGLNLTGNAVVEIDGPNYGGAGGSNVTIGGTLTNSSTNGNGLDIGNSNITSNDTVTASGLNNTGEINLQGNGTIVATLAVNGPATNNGAVDINASGKVQMGAGDAYTQAGDATNIGSGGTLAGTANVTGGSLDGTGTVVGTLNDTSGGTVFAGPSIGTPGTLTVNGTYNQSGTGDLEANIGSGGTSSGVVAVTGGYVNLNGGTLSVSSPPVVGTVLTVMTFSPGHLAGQFAAVQDGASIGDGSFVNLGDGTSIEVFYNEDSGNIQIERVNNSTLATTYTWTDGTANWSTAADWSGGQVPNSTANVLIGNTSTGNVTLNGSTGDATVNSLTIAASNALTVSSVTLTAAKGISVAAGATLSLSSGEINGSVLSGAGLLQSVSGTNALAADTISSGTSFIGQNSTTTELLGAIDNAGSIEQIGGNGQNGVLDVVSPVKLSGGGTLTLDTIATNGANAYLEGNGQTLTSNNTIQGTGIIGNGSLALINSGLIDATPESGTTTLTINSSGEITNTGTMEATGGATLVIGNPLVDNANGNITVVGTSTVELLGSTVQGGTLNNSGGGTLETVSSAELDGSTQGALTISTGSTYTASDGTTTYLLGSIVNKGLIQQNGGNGQNGVLDALSPVTLSGGGTLTLNTIATNGANAYLEGNGQTLTNTNNTIQGTGIIGNGSLVLINQHVIDATPESGTSTLTLNGSGGVTNTATLEATAGGVLVIDNTVDNAGGNITVSGSTSVTELVGATIQGGTLNNSTGGTLETISSAELDGSSQGALTLATGSTYTATDGTTTYLLGSIVNQGVIQQNGGNGQNGVLDIFTSVTLSGGGSITLDTAAANGGFAFIQGNGNTLTNTNNTIQGTGFIGNGSLTLINNDVIDAMVVGGTLGTTSLTLNGSGGVTNTDLLEASAGATLAIQTNVTNTGANITATGSLAAVTVSNNATITGGTLNTVNGGVLESTGSANLQGVTISAHSTYIASDNLSTALLGTIDNLGEIELIGGNGQNGFLLIGNAVTLTGGGTVLLDTIATNNGAAFIQGNGETLTNTNNTILGTGVIGNGNLVLINAGLVDATSEGGTSTLTLNTSGGVTNTSTMEASLGGVLVLETTVDNAGGNITTADGTSTVEIDAGTVQGGTLNNTAGGTFETVSGSELDGSTHGSLTISTGTTVTATDNTTTYLLGTIANKGLITQVGGNGQNGFLDIFSAVTLTGGGTVTLDTIATNGGDAFLIGNGNTLTNTNNTIQGTGIIGNGNLVLINESVVDATPESGTSTLTLNSSGGITNTATMEASAGGVLVIETTVDNAGGNITTADATSTVEVDAATIQGGTLNNTAGGTFETVAASELDGSTHGTLTISTGSAVTATDNTTTYLVGTINNKGSITQVGGNGQAGYLYINSAVTLTGGGTVTLDTIANNGGDAYLMGNGETLTNTNNAIQGTGIIGNGNLAVINNGVIDATPEGGTSTLTVNTSGLFTSTGTLEATGGGILALNIGAVTASGLVAVGVSSALDLTGELSLTGTLSNFGAISGGGATEVAFGSGTDRLIMGPSATFGGTVVGDGSSSTIELAAGSTAGTLVGLGTNFTNFGTVIVDAGGTWTVDAAASQLASTTFIGNGASSTLALTTAGTFSLATVSNFGTIDLAAGNNAVTVTDKTLSGGAVTIVDGASGNNTISATSDTSASKGKSLTYIAGSGTDSFTGGFENDTVDVSATAVSGDTLTGGSGTNTLVLTSAGVLSLGGVSKFPTIDLAAGNSTVTVTDALLSGAAVTINDGASGNNTISAASDTSASKGKSLTYNAGTGTDSFTGGFENDTVNVSAAAVGGDTLTGGSGTNTLKLTSAGSVSLAGVSKFPTIDLAAGGNTVTLTDTTLSVGAVTINAGASGNNSISAAGDSSASTGKTLTYNAGTGTDSFTGGFENDTVTVSATAVSGDTMAGGSGSNKLVLTTAGTVNLGGVSKFATILLAAGNNAVTLTDPTLSGGSVTLRDGASGNDTVSAATDTSASTGKILTYFAGTGTDHFTGGFENDQLHIAAASLAADVLTGSSGSNALTLTTAGSVSLASVAKFGTINLAAGNNTVTVTDKTLMGGSVIIVDGASGNNSVSAAGDTTASKGKTLTFDTGTGTDSFIGGFESDAVRVTAAAVGGDALTGGSANNTLLLASAGSVNLGGVSKFGTINLAAGNSTVTLTDTTLSGGAVSINDGASGNNNINAAGDTTARTGKTLSYFAGPGPDSFTGGFENDQLHVTAAAVGGDTLTGGSGTNMLTLTSAGSVNLGGVSKFGSILLAAGNSAVTLTDTTLSGGSVSLRDGTSGNDTVSAAGDTTASKGKSLAYFTGSGTDSFTGGFENDQIHTTVAALDRDTLTGGSGSNFVDLLTAGSLNLGALSNFVTINLAAGNNTVTVTDTTLSGGSLSLVDGTSGNNSVSAAGDTTASKGKTLTDFTGTGTDHFTGGFENDSVHVAAASVGGDALTGGSGSNTLVLSTAGSAGLGGVSKFATVDLAAGNSVVTVTDTTLSGGAVTIKDGASGSNSISAAGDTAASAGKTLTYVAGSGADSFTGGFENDTIFAGTGLGTYTAGSGTDSFVFIADNLPTQTLDSFQPGRDNILLYGIHASNGFDLGSADNGLNPTSPTAITASIFTADATGDFTSSSQRFAYDTGNGDLFYSATGSNSSESLVATLTGAPAITASNLLFEH